LKISAVILVVLVVGVLTLLYITARKAPDAYLADFKKETADLSKDKIISSYPPDLLEKRTVLDARLAMSDDDSIGMRISLRDKMVYLEIQGIVLTKTPILSYRLSPFLKNLSPAEKYFMFHSPLKIRRDESTIYKDRFKEIIAPPTRPADAPEEETPAPKDSSSTTDAKKQAEPKPDPIIYRFYLEHDLKVQITGQMPDSLSSQFWPRFRFEMSDRMKFVRQLGANILKKKPLNYEPFVRLVIDYKDAEAIYRAMPKKGNVILDI
jgi:hypothetical protein